MAKRKRLGLAGLLLAGAMSVFTPKVNAEENISQPKIIATFEYESNRPEYGGQIFVYNLWNDGKISQAYPKVEPEPEFAQRWFYDIDGDGKFGSAEVDAIKSGKLIYMHPEFNEIANEEIRKAFGSQTPKEYFPVEDYTKEYSQEKLAEPKEKPELDPAIEKAIEDLERELKEKRRQEKEKALREEIKKEFEQEYVLPLPPAPEKPTPELSKVEIKESEILREYEKPQELKEKKARNILSAISGVDYSSDFMAGSLGVRYEPIENLGLSILARQGFGKDKTISEITTPTSPQGIYGYGKVEDSDRKFTGIGGEVQLGPIILGGGVNNYTSTRETTEDLLKNGQVIKPNSYSTANSDLEGYFTAGLEFKLGNRKNFGLGANTYIPLNSEQKPSVGLRMSYRLNNRKK